MLLGLSTTGIQSCVVHLVRPLDRAIATAKRHQCLPYLLEFVMDDDAVVVFRKHGIGEIAGAVDVPKVSISSMAE